MKVYIIKNKEHHLAKNWTLLDGFHCFTSKEYAKFEADRIDDEGPYEIIECELSTDEKLAFHKRYTNE